MKPNDPKIVGAIEAAHTEYRRALVDPMSVQPWHALPTDQRHAFAKAMFSVWNTAIDSALQASLRLRDNDEDTYETIHKVHDDLEVSDG